MVKIIRSIGMLAVLLLALALSSGSTGRAYAQSSPGCDTTGTVNGTAMPTFGTIGTTLQFRATGFQPNEDVSFYITLPNQDVIGTAAPIPNGVNPDGSVGPLPFTLTNDLVNLATGRWAITFVGASSRNTAVIFFCVLTTAQATAVAQPTSAPPTATSVPATSVPATATSAPATSVPTTAASATAATTEVATAAATTTAAATVTSVATAPATMAASSTPTTAVVPTTAVEQPSPTTAVVAPPTAIMEQPTALPPVEVMPTMPTTVPGMPTTGQSDLPMLIVLSLAALGLLILGLATRRSWGGNR